MTGPRTQSWLSSATVWLFTWLFVVIRKKKGRCGGGGGGGGLLLEPGTGVWEHGWSRGLDLGERQVRAGGPVGARGPGSGIGSGPTCFVM